LHGLGERIQAVDSPQNLVRGVGEENRTLEVDGVEERKRSQRDRDSVSQCSEAHRREASRDFVDRDACEDREDGEEEDEILPPKVEPRRSPEEGGAEKESEEETPRACLTVPEERREPEAREHHDEIRRGQDLAERRLEVLKGVAERRQRGVRGGVRERPEPEVGEGPCQEHDQTDCRERRQGAGQERYAGGEPAPRVAVRAEEDVEQGEQQKGAAALFDDKGRAEERPAAQKGQETATFGRAQEDERTCEDGRQDEVLGVGRGEQELRAE